ncbi:MAG: hypothetical protein AABX77_03010 [Nanoarchaeota archaeon]
MKQTLITKPKMPDPIFLYHGTTMSCYEGIRKNWKFLGGYIWCTLDINVATGIAFKRSRQETNGYKIGYENSLGHPIILVADSNKHKVERLDPLNYKIMERLDPESHRLIDLSTIIKQNGKIISDKLIELINIHDNAKDLSDFLF